MRAIMVMYDSLSKDYLSAYGCDEVITPNFKRLSEKSLRFNNFYVGSMPCMPARRELHTGRYNFMHRGWGAIEPFDDSMPEILKCNGVYSHLVTDHYHYLEDGGCTYHNKYSSWECFRGQEGDFWKGEVGQPDIPQCEAAGEYKAKLVPQVWRQDWINRKYMDYDAKMPQSQTFAAGLEFIEKNKNQDKWFLQIETFDPHEPFFTQKEYKDLYPHEYKGKHFDWPPYGAVKESEMLVNHAKKEYSALVTMCDAKLGLVLDAMDKNNMWEDTMLIVNTDHGFLLGEHYWWAKGISPLYNEVANTPFFIFDPRYKACGECNSLAQTIDIAPTLLEFFGLDIPYSMMGKPLKEAYEDGKVIHESIIYGYFGGTMNVTDGKHTLLKSPSKTPLFEYTLMPTNMRGMFSMEQLKNTELFEGFSFLKGCKVMKIPSKSMYIYMHCPIDMLFDVENDPKQQKKIKGDVVECKLIGEMLKNMRKSEAPAELYERLQLPAEGEYTAEMLKKSKDESKAIVKKLSLDKDIFDETAVLYLASILPYFSEEEQNKFSKSIDDRIKKGDNRTIDIESAELILVGMNFIWRHARQFLVVSDLYKNYVKA